MGPFILLQYYKVVIPVSYEEILIPSWKIPKQDVREQWKVALPSGVCIVKGIPNQILL